MMVDVKPFLEYQNRGEDIYEALGLWTCDKRKKFRSFLEKSDLTKCLSVSDRAVYPTSWVGSICYGKRQVEILPKLLSNKTAKLKDGDEFRENEDKLKNQENQQHILDNLIFMLSYTRKLNIKVAKDASLSQSPNPFLEILIKEFAVSLFEALKRQTPRAYMRQEENLNYVKGKIQITANISYNSCNRAKFFCEYDEFSEDNQLNRLFLYVATMLSSLTQNRRTKQILTHIRNYYCDVSPVCFTKEQAKKIILSRSQQIFVKPMQLALMFIEHASVDMSNHRINSIALLWDMNKLFEEFIYEVMRRHCGKNYQVRYQHGKRLLKDVETSRKRRDTFVDIFVECDDKRVIIVDTKYKKFFGISDIANSDIYQVSTYCLLHGSKKAVIIYPQWDEQKNNVENMVSCELNTNIGHYSIQILAVNIKDSLNASRVIEIGKMISDLILK